ncbi:MAG: hypothetical protein Tsb004_15470 [Allomuricauda sp.]
MKMTHILFVILTVPCLSVVRAQEPRLFLEEVLTEKVEYGLTLTPDKNTAYFVKTDSFYISTPQNIYKSYRVNNTWTKPEMASFSGTGSDSSPFVSPDGKKLFFTSRRDINGIKATGANIWYVNLENGYEGKPIYLSGVNSDKSEYSPTVDKQGNLYFGSYRAGGFGSGDIWMSKYENGTYQKVTNLGPMINTEHGEWGSCISPDGSYLIFENSGRKENLSPSGDLYISFFKENGWQKPSHFSAPINSKRSDLTPKIHGDTFYFASNRDTEKNTLANNVDFYAIPLSTLVSELQEHSIQFRVRDFLKGDEQTSAGASWSDINNDGYIDLIIANAQKQHNKVYLNLEGKGFSSVDLPNLSDDASSTSAIAFADFDNDGDQDAIFGNQHGEDNVLYKNEKGNFRLHQTFTAGDTYHINWIDYNNDGALDCFIPNAQTGLTQLFEQKEGRFVPLNNAISELVGFHSGTSWLDINNDDFQDLYIPVAGSSDAFFKYNKAIGDLVTDQTILGKSVNNINFTSGVSFGDYDNDGDLDAFLANLNNQKNILLTNNNGLFEETKVGWFSEELSSWVGLWGDYDNDGDLDLFVSNYDRPNSIFLNSNGQFHKIQLKGITDQAFLTSGMAWADYNKDGALDIVLANWEKQANIFLEGVPNGNNWIGFKLQGTSSNRDAIGAKVTIMYETEEGNTIQYREIQSNMGLRSYPERIAHFGLGNEKIKTLKAEVKWPSGKVSVFKIKRTNAYYQLIEGDGKMKDL